MPTGGQIYLAAKILTISSGTNRRPNFVANSNRTIWWQNFPKFSFSKLRTQKHRSVCLWQYSSVFAFESVFLFAFQCEKVLEWFIEQGKVAGELPSAHLWRTGEFSALNTTAAPNIVGNWKEQLKKWKLKHKKRKRKLKQKSNGGFSALNTTAAPSIVGNWKEQWNCLHIHQEKEKLLLAKIKD